MTNTEKPTTKAESKKQGIVKTPSLKKQSLAPKENKKQDTLEKKEVKPVKELKKSSEKKKKGYAEANVTSLPISTKKSMAICKFIKYKTIKDAISDLEKVVQLKKAVPMKGEIPHRKGKIMSGRFPKKTAENFIRVLRGLVANADQEGIDDPVIIEASANMASRPRGRFGRVARKRTHLRIVVKEKIIRKNKSDSSKTINKKK